MPSPSPRIVPSAEASNGLAFAGRRQGRRLAEAHVHENVVERIDAAGQTMSARPVVNSRQARCRALSELAQAASTTQLVPPRSKRLAMRPATTLPSKPGKEFSCQPT